MSQVVGIRFERAGKVCYFDPKDLNLRLNDIVVLETEKGLELGRVVIDPDQVMYSEVKEPLKPVLRTATEEDLQRGEELKARAKEALANSEEQANNLNLAMKI